MGRLVFWLIVGVLGWALFQCFSAVYDDARVKDIMETAAIQHRYENSDRPIVNEVVDKVTAMGPEFTIKSKNIDVSRRADLKGATIRMSYTKTIQIPVVHRTWIFHFNPVVEGKVDF